MRGATVIVKYNIKLQNYNLKEPTDFKIVFYTLSMKVFNYESYENLQNNDRDDEVSPWSCGYDKKLTAKRSRVPIPLPYTVWIS